MANITRIGGDGSYGEPTLLWTNASPNSEFAPQTITVSGASYSAYIVEIRKSTGSAETSLTTGSAVIEKNKSSQQLVAVTTVVAESSESAVNAYNRYVRTATDTTIEFGNGVSSSIVSNTAAIPTRIWGVKWTLS